MLREGRHRECRNEKGGYPRVTDAKEAAAHPLIIHSCLGAENTSPPHCPLLPRWKKIPGSQKIAGSSLKGRQINNSEEYFQRD